MSAPEIFDIAIIGGGINGAAVARDAAGRGLKVYLAEAKDYARGTSSASSKLIHGGIRYLEQFEFRLVSESLHERETLMKLAPHLVFPMEFLVPVTRGQVRPAWMVRIGLLLYDVLSGRKLLGRSGQLSKAEMRALPRLRQDNLKAVLHYPDCWADDARLTLETLLDARARGADIGNYREVTAVTPATDGYVLKVLERGTLKKIHARFVVNAGGPWATRVLGLVDGGATPKGLKLVRGSHIVIPMPDPAFEKCYLMQNDDKRVVFVIPWLDNRFLILGTTDLVHDGDPASPVCTPEERDYILACYRKYFDHPVTAADVVYSYSGVRPLVDDGADNPSKVTRDYELDVTRNGTGGLITIYGGKLTTHRKLGELVMDRLKGEGLKMPAPWTDREPVHGGALDRQALEKLAQEGPDTIAPAVRRRWAFTYGAATADLYARIAAAPELARDIVPGVPEAELAHAVEVEDVLEAEDFLTRRTKLFMFLDESARLSVAGWFTRRLNRPAAAEETGHAPA